MKGFKSFANRTKIEFDNRITAIVGPNGSGKSNISDAVKWVLGEQSIKSLRGKKMPDVIFSGGENSSPLNLASVDLLFSNEDKALDLPYDNVKISRRIYRNGDNEYKINGKKVRLKDIRELFLDTGIGKEGYSVIGQGRIDEIINSSPKERRSIFEEASGISKHKYRRDESEKKLEKVSENLEIIEREWEYKDKELKSLKIQKNNFEKNKYLTEDLDKKSYFYFQKKSNKLVENLDNINVTIKNIDNSKKDKNKNLEKINEKLIPFKDDISSLQEELDNSLEKISNLEKNIERNKNKKELSKQNLEYKKKDQERNYIDRKTNSEKKEKIEVKIKSDQKDLKQTEEKLTNLKSFLKEKETYLKDLDENISKKKIRLKNLSFEKSALDKKLYEYDLSEKTNIILSKQREENENRVKEKVKAIEDEIKVLEDKILNIEESLKASNQRLEDDQSEYLKKKSDLEKLISSNKLTRERLNTNNISLKEELANYKIQKDLLSRNEGYFYSVQEFLKESNNAGMEDLYLDTLANLINVKNGYEEVIEILMTSSLQNIVTRTKDDTRQLINLVNRKKLGRITFLPLDSIKSFRKNRPDEKEVIAMAYDLVKYNTALTNVINQFLGSTVVVKNIDDAISLSKKIKGYKIITLDLDVINTWGSMVAGKNSRKRSNVGIINRSKKIEELKRKIISLREKNKELSNNVSENETRIEDVNIDLENINQSIIKNKEHIQNLTGDLRHQTFQKDSLEKRKAEELDSLGQSYKEEEVKDIGFVREKLEEINEDLNSTQNSLDDDEKNHIETNNDLIKINNQIEILTRDKNLLINSLEENKTNLNNLVESERFGEKISSSLKKDIENLGKDIVILSNKIEDNENLIKVLRGDEKRFRNLIEEKSKANFDMVEEANSLEKELGELDLTLVKQNYKKESLEKDIENLEDEIGPFLSKSIKEIDKLYNDQEGEDVTKKDLIGIQKEINKVGFFTTDSLDLYEEAYKDFSFLDKQKKDLEVSKVDIEKMIKKLETEMKDEFIKNFKIIDKKFQTIFETLFMGGKAKLSLDEDDELAAGIEIMACPPGKSTKSISLLSGGEKSLTAVALLFALFETNPAPFSLLDEIDAALDESNIKRYIEYLKSLSDKTQFVMITHRQTTMQLAERIHGVTIGDDGISKVYSIDFEEN